MTQAISSLVGILLSLILHLVPKVREWWATQRGKVLILLTFHIGGAVAIWTATCILHLPINIAVDCTPFGLTRAAWTGTVGFIANQSTYGLTNYGIPYVKARFYVHPS